MSKAHQAANQAGEEATRGTTPAKLQSAAAKGYNAEQTAQSLEDAPRADINDPKVWRALCTVVYCPQNLLRELHTSQMSVHRTKSPSPNGEVILPWPSW